MKHRGRPDIAIVEVKDLGDNVFSGGWELQATAIPPRGGLRRRVPAAQPE
jgi:hypothetical protein